MQSTSPASKDSLLRHLGLALVAALLTAVCGGASAQAVRVWVAADNYLPISPAACGPASNHFKVCVDQGTVTTAGYDDDKHVAIVWNLDPGTWSFDTSIGIDIQNKNKWIPRWFSPTLFVAFNKKDGTSYKYNINLVNGGQKLPFDPTIMN